MNNSLTHEKTTAHRALTICGPSSVVNTQRRFEVDSRKENIPFAARLERDVGDTTGSRIIKLHLARGKIDFDGTDQLGT